MKVLYIISVRNKHDKKENIKVNYSHTGKSN